MKNKKKEWFFGIANLVNLTNVVILAMLQPNLNWLLLIFRALILCSSVEAGI